MLMDAHVGEGVYLKCPRDHVYSSRLQNVEISNKVRFLQYIKDTAKNIQSRKYVYLNIDFLSDYENSF